MWCFDSSNFDVSHTMNYNVTPFVFVWFIDAQGAAGLVSAQNACSFTARNWSLPPIGGMQIRSRSLKRTFRLDLQHYDMFSSWKFFKRAVSALFCGLLHIHLRKSCGYFLLIFESFWSIIPWPTPCDLVLIVVVIRSSLHSACLMGKLSGQCSTFHFHARSSLGFLSETVLGPLPAWRVARRVEIGIFEEIQSPL